MKARFVLFGLLVASVLLAQIVGDPVLEPVTTAALDTAHKTDQTGWVFYHPVTVVPATADPTSIWANRARAITITEVWCETDANTATVNFQRDDGSPVNILSADLVCDVNPGQSSCASGCDVNTIVLTEDNVAIGEELDHVTVSLGTINRLTVVVKYTVD